MVFRKEYGKVNVTFLVERISRFAVVMRNEDRQSKPIMEALIQGLAPLPSKTIGVAVQVSLTKRMTAWISRTRVGK